MEPLFLTKDQVLAYHRQQIELFGGQPGVGDPNLLDSALAQPQNLYLYNSQADLFDIAAAYAFHLAKNHPFNDGNKRAALQAALGFLGVNGFQLTASSTDLYNAMIRLTTSELDKAGFAKFLRDNSKRTGG